MINIDYMVVILVFAAALSFVIGFFAGALKERNKLFSSGIVQALKRDAERYRHLRNVASSSDWDYIGNQLPDVIDLEVDAAMENRT